MRILFLSRWLPYPPDNGSRLRVFCLLKQLAQAHEIDLVTFAESVTIDDPAPHQALAEYCSSVTIVPYHDFRPYAGRALAGFLAAPPRSLVATHSQAMSDAALGVFKRNPCDLVVASQLGMAPYALELPDVPRLLEELELSTLCDALHQRGPLLRRLRRRLTWLKLSTFLRRILPEFAACTVVSEIERRNLHMAVPGYTRLRVIPNAVEPDRYTGPYGPPRPNSLIFAGSLTYQANYDAVAYCLESIYPTILRDAPDVALWITGGTRGIDLSQLPRRGGVTFTGYLADVRPVVATSWASVVPLRIGGGTRLKILESMALGTPVVSTPKGAEGLDVIDGRNILLAETPREFAGRVIDLLRSAELRAKLAAAGRQLVTSRYDWTVVGRDWRALVEEIAAPRDDRVRTTTFSQLGLNLPSMKRARGAR